MFSTLSCARAHSSIELPTLYIGTFSHLIGNNMLLWQFYILKQTNVVTVNNFNAEIGFSRKRKFSKKDELFASYQLYTRRDSNAVIKTFDQLFAQMVSS